MKPYFQDSQLTIFSGDAETVLRTMPDESVQCCVTSPPYYGLYFAPYYGLPPYCGTMRLWQTRGNSKKVSAGASQRSSRKASTGDRASRIGISNGSLPSTSKSSGQQVRLRQKSDALTRTFSSGLRSTRFPGEALAKRGQSSTGALKVKPTQCTANAGAQITTGRVDVRRSVRLFIHQKSGQKLALLFGSATRLSVNGAVHIRA